MAKTILMTGASGLIGQHLVAYFLEQGYFIYALTRQINKISTHPKLNWVNEFIEIPEVPLQYVINLAGESIGQKRWSAERKQQLIESRVETTRALYVFLKQRKLKPEKIISGSAIGYYGIDPEEHWTALCSETSPAQSIFVSELCQRWENEALSDTEQNTVIIRLGVVLAKNAPVLKQMLFPIKLNLFGKLGHGAQPFVWVHIQDVLAAIDFILQMDQPEHIYNVVAPSHDTQATFVHVASQILGKTPFFNFPSSILNMILGEQAQLVLNGQYVIPKALLAQNFEFKFNTLNAALTNLLIESV